MRPIADSSRRRLWGSAVLLCAGGLALLPLAARPSMRLPQRPSIAQNLTLPQIPLAHVPAEIRLQRDPFAPDPPPATPAPSPGAAEDVTLQALVTGTAPYALVAIGGSVRVVRAGMPLLGSRVAAIDAGGLHLENGATLRFTSAQP